MSLVGDRISDLLKLRRRAIPVTDTIILTKLLFKEFARTGSIPEAVVDKIAQAAGELGPDSNRIFVRHSTTGTYLGLVDKVVTTCNYSELKHSIERVYRSWSDDTARASRIINKITEEDAMPAIFIQKYHEDVQSLTTRIAASGESTTKESYWKSVASTLQACTQDHQDFLREVESVRGYPSEVHFLEDGGRFSVCGVKNQAIADDALLRALLELHERDTISTRDLLKNIKPSMLGNFTAYQLPSNSITAVGRGLPISPGARLGELMLNRTDNTETITGSHILAWNEFSPHDVRATHAAGGVILTRGGMTSHGALACRGLSTPAVVLLAAFVDMNEGCVQLQDGTKVREGSVALLNGSRGTVDFLNASMAGARNLLSAQYHLPKTIIEHGAFLISALSEFESPDALRLLPLDEQLHMAELRVKARKVGLMP